MAETKSINDLKVEMEQELAAMRAARAALEAQPAASGGIGADQLEAILARTTKAAGQASELLASKMKPENADHRHLGPFENKEGGILNPKPDLKRDIYFGNFRQRVGELTPGEVDALNGLSDSLARGQKRLARDGRWKAIVSDNDERLSIEVPMRSMDDRADLPSIAQIAIELTSGERSMDTNDIMQELASLRTKVSTLEGAAV